MKATHCKKCEYCYRFSCGNQWFMGCKYPPYQGRWIKQIERCPKEQDHPIEKGGRREDDGE